MDRGRLNKSGQREGERMAEIQNEIKERETEEKGKNTERERRGET